MKKRVKRIRNSLKNGKFKFAICFAVFYFTFIALNFIFGDKGYLRIKDLQAEKIKITGEIEKIKLENQKLTRELAAAKDVPFWIEKAAREQLDLVKNGEIVYKFLDKQEKK